jgi:hypothetical protein
VAHRNPSLSEYSPNEEPAMASRRILLAAHDRHVSLANEILEPLQPAQEGPALGDLPIEDVSVLVIEGRVLGASPQGVTEEYVSGAPPLENPLDDVAVEMRRVVRVRGRSHIGHDADAPTLEESHEVLHALIGVADRED